MRRLIVRETAKAKGLSMAGLQRAAHLDRNTAQRVWRNKLHSARPATLEKIAKALGVLPSELFMDDGEGSGEEEMLFSPEEERNPHGQSEALVLFAPPLAQEEATQQARVLKALAEPTRLRILSQLSQHERKVSVGELASAYRLAQPTISNHLRTLQYAGLISCYKDEQWSYYYLNRDAIQNVSVFLINTLIGSHDSREGEAEDQGEISSSQLAKKNDRPSD